METQATDKMLEKVRALIAKAESTDSGPEAEALLQKASALMLKHSIDEAMLEATRPADKRTKPEALDRIMIVPQGTPIKEQLVDLAGHVAEHFGCRIVYFGLKSKRVGTAVWATIVGYPSDLRSFETMFTALSLDLASRLQPRPDVSKGFDENVYDLHEAGVKWREIARLMNVAFDAHQPEGWRASVRPSKDQPELLVPWPDGHRLINAYRRHCKAIGEEPRAIQSPVTYQRNFATGYVRRVWHRFIDMRIKAQEEASVGTALVLRGDAVDETVDEMFPKLGLAPKRKGLAYDARARRAGEEAGAKADLGGNNRFGAGGRRELS